MPRRSSTGPDNYLFTRVKRLVDAADIEGLRRMGCPDDESDPEASRIAASVRTMDVQSVESVEALVAQVWGVQFGPLADGREDAYESAFHALALSIVAEVESMEAAHG